MKISKLTSYYVITFLSLVLLSLVTFFTYEKNSLQTFIGDIMGTTYKVILSTSSKENINQNIFQIFNSVNKEMSTYIPSSSISKLNRTTLNEWMEVSSDFIKVANFSQEVCFLTQGAFDISVGNIVNFYGFGPDKFRDSVDTSKIEKHKQGIGCNSFELNLKNNQIRRVRDVYLDMSGIAKGYAVDLLSDYLDRLSINSYLIELGGEIKFKGNKSSSEPWIIGIENPASINNPIQTISSKDQKNIALATSGEYRNFRKVDGVIISHTIDPRTFRPLKRQHSSISVIANKAMEADALATALNVMGFEAGLKFANTNHIKVIYIFKEEDSFTFQTSKWL